MPHVALKPAAEKGIDATVPERYGGRRQEAARNTAALKCMPRAATESRNSVTKIKPNTPHSAYYVTRPSVRLTCVYMVRLSEARTDRDGLLRNRTNT
ncbi:hypothetical protein EVAR_99425_1 [Eumeta japonica]|uniref:Uncharacterized protein n=1 Tax=Eumeta variegata TaxID=151549 RepID=A0A4C1ZEH2_EUMVA|nr:hypothetical protein EVAR_99425_1 [Eumeta japonica]